MSRKQQALMLFALQVIAAGETTDPAGMARIALGK